MAAERTSREGSELTREGDFGRLLRSEHLSNARAAY